MLPFPPPRPRLQTLLADTCEQLMRSFHSANERVCALRAAPARGVDVAELERTCADLSHHLAIAITALQFQDMGSQLIHHTHRRLRSCADRVAREAMGDDEDGETVVEEAPLRPNPVTQDEMDAGSIELF